MCLLFTVWKVLPHHPFILIWQIGSIPFFHSTRERGSLGCSHSTIDTLLVNKHCIPSQLYICLSCGHSLFTWVHTYQTIQLLTYKEYYITALCSVLCFNFKQKFCSLPQIYCCCLYVYAHVCTCVCMCTCS